MFRLSNPVSVLPQALLEQERLLSLLVIGLFFLSGFSALIYQVVWQRLLGLIVGVDVYAVSIIVATFMIGLGAGSYFGGLLADRMRRKFLIAAFASAELFVGIIGFCSKGIFYDWLGSMDAADINELRILASILVLLVPTFFMGLSLPLLTKALVLDTKDVGMRIACLYGVNALGAALGALLSTIILIRLTGIPGAFFTAASLNLIAAAGCFAIPVPVAKDAEVRPAEIHATHEPFQFSTFALAYFLSGFTALSLETLWFQLLGVLLKSTSFTFSWLLFLYLGGLGAGSLAGAFIVVRSRRPFTVFLALQSSVVIYSAVSLIVLLRLINLEVFPKHVMGYLAYYEPMSTAALLHLEPTAVFLYCFICGTLIVPPTFLMGFSFPYFQKAAQNDIKCLGARVGFLQFTNILGATFGTAAIGLVALNILGASGCLKIVMSCGGIFVLLWCHLLLKSSKLIRILSFLGCFALIGVCFYLLPGTNELWSTFHATNAERIIVSESASGLTVLKAENQFDKKVGVFVNGLGQSFLPFGEQEIHTQLGMLPIFVHRNPVDVGIVGLGSGDTLFGAGGRAETKSIHCVELIKSEYFALQKLAEKRDDPALNVILNDKRISYEFTDGRQFIGKSEKLYDVLEADALRPRSAYSNNVFSVEYFTLLKRHLKPGGIAVTWVPTRRVQQTFASVFPHNVQCGDLLLGSDVPIQINRAQIDSRLNNSFSSNYYRLGNIDAHKLLREISSNPQVIRTDAAYIKTSGLNTDLYPRDEFASPTP